MSKQRHWETHYPSILAIISVPGWIYLFRWLNLSTQESKDLFAAILNVSAIAAGFLGTTASILLTMGPSKTINDLKEANLMPLVHKYLMAGIRHQFVLVLLSILLWLIFPKLHNHRLLLVLPVLWGVIATLASLSSYRIIDIFGKVIASD